MLKSYQKQNQSLQAFHQKLEKGWRELGERSDNPEAHVEQLSVTNRRSFGVLLESISEGVLLVDAQGKILYANGRAFELFRAEDEKLIGLRIESLLPKPIRERHVKLREAFIANPSVRRMGQGRDLFAQRLDGSSFPAEISLSYLDDTEERIYVAFVTDITERKQQEQAMVQTGKFAAIGELAGNIAHEINNPIGIISAKARLILSADNNTLSDKAQVDLQKIVDQCTRLSKLTRGLLDFSRPSLGEKTAVRLHQPIRSALVLINDRAGQRKVEVLERLFAEDDTVVGNVNELQQVFLNLFLNAFDAMPNGGRLTVETEMGELRSISGSNCIRVRISDTGDGIPEESIDGIFEPFYTTKEDGGTGLGLSICQGLIRSHRGDIYVDSTAKNGTTFVLEIPSPAEST